MAYSIVKELTGEVSINSTTGGNTIKQMDVDACLFFSNRRKAGGVYIVDSLGGEFWLDVSLVDSTQILPSAAVDFTGTPRDLYELLEASFFYNVVNPPSGGGGGGVIESNILLQGSNYTITTSDYIIVATTAITLTLPLSPSVGQVYKIYANANTVQIDANVGQQLIGKTSVSIRKQSAVIVQYIKTNAWAII